MIRLPRENSYWKADGELRLYFVYVMSNSSMTLYTGVSNDVMRRAAQHKVATEGFTSRYHFDRLVYFESHDLITQAIQREKQIKGWSRAKKVALIKTLNPEWRDLSQP